jgi:hypothetical protein
MKPSLRFLLPAPSPAGFLSNAGGDSACTVLVALTLRVGNLRRRPMDSHTSQGQELLLPPSCEVHSSLSCLVAGRITIYPERLLTMTNFCNTTRSTLSPVSANRRIPAERNRRLCF